MADLDNPGPADIAEAREVLQNAGYEARAMSDEQAIEAMRSLLAETIVAPPPRAGAPPVNARVWLTEALTAGGFAQPEDREQRADLGDGGESVHLAVLAVLVMRHTTGGKPTGWTDEELADQLKQPVADVKRGQALLDEVAVAAGKPAATKLY
jgi:hypothetical protein